jgi:phage gp16-like protein
MVDEGFEHQDASEIEVKMWIPTDAKGQEAKEKKIKANNKVLAHLSGEVVDPLDEEAWMQALPGGNLHDAIKEKAAVHVKNNEYNGNKNWQFEFNAAKPKVQTLEEFKRQYQLKKVQREAEQVDLG